MELIGRWFGVRRVEVELVVRRLFHLCSCTSRSRSIRFPVLEALLGRFEMLRTM